ncbi:hypothetical protein BGX28_001167 [Mortierella sp. GBA30]|nr:hypothetical protein BGX28_001167 [Mortierella sp. GBA30]
MGVSGVGKSSAAKALVSQTHWVFQEGDELHPEANVTKMAAGHPLVDDDRWPWLRRVSEWIGHQELSGHGAVITCSALKRSYRDLIRDGHPSVRFVHLLANEDILTERVTSRQGHYMPPSLLHSQLELLEPLEADELGVKVETNDEPDVVAAHAIEALRTLETATGSGRDDTAYLKYLDYKYIDPTTPIESVLNPKLLETFDVAQGVWGPDSNGARCGVCKLAHDMAEGTYQFNPNKVIGVDSTCAFRKWTFFSWGVEFYSWIIALVMLGIIVDAGVIFVLARNHRTRHFTIGMASKATPSWLKSRKTLNKSIKMHDQQ